MKKIFFLICFLIVYGSLYPFKFAFYPPSPDQIAPLLHFNIFETGISDLVSNIVLFIPYGLFFLTVVRFSDKRHQLLYCVVSAFLFGYVIQVGQLWASGRLPWGGDAVLNTIGAIIGMAVGRVLNIEKRRASVEKNPVDTVFLFLGVGFIIIKLAPFAPSIDIEVLKNNIKALLLSPEFDWYWMYEHAVSWLVGLYFLSCGLSRADTPSRAGHAFMSARSVSFLVVGVLAIKCIIISSSINLSQVAGAGVALFIWLVARKKLTVSLLSVLLLVAIVANGFYPFELRNTPHSFNWIPFTGSLNGNLLLNIVAVSKKLLFYAGAVWLLTMAINKFWMSAIIVAVLVLISEIGQVYVSSSVAESTDAFLVLLAAFIIRQFVHHSSVLSEQADVREQRKSEQPATNPKAAHRQSNYIAGLDGLRAFAAMAVFIVHFQQFTEVSGSWGPIDFTRWMINGNTGVALFFALSGFLLSIPFWKGILNHENIALRTYFWHRALRIIPVYYLCFFALIAIKGFSGPEVNFNNILSHLFFLHNLKDKQVMSLNPPFWTLAVEVQFYLLLPLLFLGLKRVSYTASQWVVALIIIGWAAAFIATMTALESWSGWPLSFPLIWPFGFYAADTGSPAITYSTVGHFPHFLLGVLAASFFATDRKVLNATTRDVIAFMCCLLLVAILATDLDDILQLPFGRYNFPFVPVLLTLLIFVIPNSNWFRNLLEFSLLKWLGIISYGIYLFHYPIQKAVKLGFEQVGGSVKSYPWSFGAMALVITVVAATLSYLLFEKPLMNRLKVRNTRLTHRDNAVPPMKSDEHHNVVTSAPSMMSDEHRNVATSQPSTNSDEYPDLRPSEQNTPNSVMQNRDMKSPGKILLPAGAVIAVVVVIIAFFSSNNQMTTVSQPAWAGKGVTMIFDHHAHTQYSDGELDAQGLVELAYLNGCDAMSITDHSNYGTSISMAKLNEIRRLRKQYPGMLIFSGIEIGLPSYDTREHMNIISTPEFEQTLLLNLNGILESKSFKNDIEKELAALSVLQDHNAAFAPYISVYNHPARKDKNLSENIEDYHRWAKAGFNLTAFSGAPGHQKDTIVGSYKEAFTPSNRWDPVVAEVGGVWDTLLSEGKRVWGAIASSDYHNDKLDYPPCGFARIHVSVPDVSYTGIIKGMQAGTFWADHGQLLDTFDFALEVGAQRELAYPGAEVALPAEENVFLANVNITRGERYSQDFMKLDVITNCIDGKVTVIEHLLPPETSRQQVMIAKAKNIEQCFVRARISRETAEDDNLSAYTNPVFVRSH